MILRPNSRRHSRRLSGRVNRPPPPYFSRGLQFANRTGAHNGHLPHRLPTHETGDARPTDEGIVVGIEVTDRSGVVVLPNVGDFVQIDNSMQQPRDASFSGRVRSRVFRYIGRNDSNVKCTVNIVLRETDDDWGPLQKL